VEKKLADYELLCHESYAQMTALPADTSSTSPSVRWCGLAFRSHEQGSTIALGDVGRRNRAAAEEILADGEVHRFATNGDASDDAGWFGAGWASLTCRGSTSLANANTSGATVPFLPRDPRRVEDVDSRGPDHAADARRYALLCDQREVMTHDMF
jgi:hypothetical protein